VPSEQRDPDIGAARRRPNETEAERADRNLTELLGELRVALPGVQVLFAFLLTVPFSQRFLALTQTERAIFYVTLLLTALATLLLIAPTAHHRVRFRQQDKERIVEVSNRLVIAGLAFLALAMAGAVLLITLLLYGDDAAIAAAVTATAFFALVWFGWPLARRVRTGGRERPG
jgi:Family of unknown function (DUF6328)